MRAINCCKNKLKGYTQCSLSPINATLDVHQVLSKLYTMYYPSCTPGTVQAVHQVLSKLYTRYYPSCTPGTIQVRQHKEKLYTSSFSAFVRKYSTTTYSQARCLGKAMVLPSIRVIYNGDIGTWENAGLFKANDCHEMLFLYINECVCLHVFLPISE